MSQFTPQLFRQLVDTFMPLYYRYEGNPPDSVIQDMYSHIDNALMARGIILGEQSNDFTERANDKADREYASTHRKRQRSIQMQDIPIGLKRQPKRRRR